MDTVLPPALMKSPMLAAPQNRTTSMISGWTASHIAPHGDLHQITHTALNPNPAQANAIATLTNHVLGVNDHSLESRTTGSVTPPEGTPTGTASVFQNSGIPATVQAAIGNLGENTAQQQQNNLLTQILQGLGALGIGGNSVVADPTQQALARARLATMNAPAQIQAKMAAVAPAAKVPTGIQTITPALTPNTSQINAANQWQDLNAQLGQAQRAAGATGWTPYVQPNTGSGITQPIR